MKDSVISICKALAIIMVVTVSAGAPEWLTRVALPLSAPIFFLCTGYLFRTQYFHNERTFVVNRIRNLYIPFIKWAVFFLIAHNLFMLSGIENGFCGTATGATAHYYSWTETFQRLWSITFNMSGYDEFLCGTFWFFRSLFVGSIAFLIGMKLLHKIRPEDNMAKTSATLFFLILILLMWKISAGLWIPGLADGGYQELAAAGFISLGFLIRTTENTVKKEWIPAVGGLVILILSVLYFPLQAYEETMPACLSLWLPSIGGFYLLLYLSKLVSQYDNALKKALVYIGNHTLYIFAFHLIAFKLVSAIKVANYGLPWQMVGGHPVVQHNTGDMFWLLYIIAGIGLPLAWRYGFHYLAARVDISTGACLKYALSFSLKTGFFIARLSKRFILGIRDTFVGIWRALVEIIKASNPGEE